MANLESVVLSLFEENKDGKIPVKLALQKVRGFLPEVSARAMGKMLRKCFAGNLRRFRPGKSKRNRNPAWAYYGISPRCIPVPPIQPGSMVVPESWGNPQLRSSPMLRGVELLIERVRTPDDDTKQLVDENAALKKQLEEVKQAEERRIDDLQRKLQEAVVARRRTTPVNSMVPPCMYLRREDLPAGGHVGCGTYGSCSSSVYKGIPVVVKEALNPESKSVESLRKTVLAEANTILSLKASPNLPMLIGVCVTGPPPFCLVTQYWGKTSLWQAIHHKRLLGSVPWVDVIQQVVDGVDVIHSSGFVHNDLKEDNIVLREDLHFSPLIIDFGKSVAMGGSSSPYRLTIKEQLQWRRRYPWIAPELLANKDKPSASTDVYSIGFIISCITRKRPIPVLKNAQAVTYLDEPAKRASLLYVREIMRA